MTSGCTILSMHYISQKKAIGKFSIFKRNLPIIISAQNKRKIKQRYDANICYSKLSIYWNPHNEKNAFMCAAREIGEVMKKACKLRSHDSYAGNRCPRLKTRADEMRWKMKKQQLCIVCNNVLSLVCSRTTNNCGKNWFLNSSDVHN